MDGTGDAARKESCGLRFSLKPFWLDAISFGERKEAAIIPTYAKKNLKAGVGPP